MSAPINEPIEEGDSAAAPVRPWPGFVWLALPEQPDAPTLLRIYDLLSGRFDEQRRRMDAQGHGLDDLHQRQLHTRDQVDALERAVRSLVSTVGFLNDTCKTLEARIADLEGRRAV